MAPPRPSSNVTALVWYLGSGAFSIPPEQPVKREAPRAHSKDPDGHDMFGARAQANAWFQSLGLRVEGCVLSV